MSGNLAQSFWIAGALFVLPIAAMVYFVVTDLSAQIEFADKERLGAEYIAPLVRFQRAVIDYRTGVASPPAVDGTSEATEADLAAAVERAAQEVGAVDQLNGGILRVADLWEIASRDWTRIKLGMHDVTREERLAATDTLLVRLRKSIQDVADSSNLTLDPEIHTYYLMDTLSQKVPQALQFLGDGRDAGIASRNSAALADMVRFRSSMTSAAVASDQIRNSVKRAVESYVPLDGTVGPAAKKAQDAIEGVVRFAETGTPDTTTSSSDPASPEPQFEPSALEPPDPPPLPAALHDPMDPVSARVPAVAGGPTPSGTPFEIRDVSAWREATDRAVEALTTTADKSAVALQTLLLARVTDFKVTLWMRVVFTVGFCLVAVVTLRLLSGNQVRVARERNEEAARIAAENQNNQQAILRLMDELAEISEGNLAARTTVTPEITGAIADSINATVTELYGVVTGIDTAAKQVTNATDEARVVASRLASSARAQSTRIKDAATAVQLMTRSITEVSETAKRSADVAKHTLDAAETGAQAVHSSITNMESIRAQIQETSKRIKRLGESSQEIGEIVDLISDITEQTNVLALNAAIQAAAAGEAGRGFTVVAEEVQRLAEHSATATNEIAALVKTIQSDTQDATTAMEQSTQRVVEGTRLSDSTGSALIDIERVSKDLAGLVQSIFVSTQMQTEIAQGVSANMGGILDVTEKTTTGAGYIASAMNQLTETAGHLKRSVARFRL
ncbi:MAG: methyl-accepting chemotaxis protein [Pseudomonadota bacterium]|nr:methyl-accepting chemotaxis protein [Pseudomonadota bacterium]